MDNYEILGHYRGKIIYLIIEEDDERFFKIGKTTNTETRIPHYFTHNPHMMSVLFAKFPDFVNLDYCEKKIRDSIRKGNKFVKGTEVVRVGGYFKKGHEWSKLISQNRETNVRDEVTAIFREQALLLSRNAVIMEVTDSWLKAEIGKITKKEESNESSIICIEQELKDELQLQRKITDDLTTRIEIISGIISAENFKELDECTNIICPKLWDLQKLKLKPKQTRSVTNNIKKLTTEIFEHLDKLKSHQESIVEELENKTQGPIKAPSNCMKEIWQIRKKELSSERDRLEKVTEWRGWT